MNSRNEGVIAIVVAFFVLLSAMWDARVSAVVAVVALVALGVYHLVRKDR
jgi:EamA domain-containing membrane protein RarD